MFLLEDQRSQALLYVVDFSSSCALTGFFLEEGFLDEDFGIAFFRFAFDEGSPPSVLLPLPTAALAAFASAAALRFSCCLGQDMSIQVTQGRLPPTTFISGEPHASQSVPKGMISPRGGSE